MQRNSAIYDLNAMKGTVEICVKKIAQPFKIVHFVLISRQASQNTLFFLRAQSLASLERWVRLDPKNSVRIYRTKFCRDQCWVGCYFSAWVNFKPRKKTIWNTANFSISYIFIFRGLEDVLLSGFRALSEQRPIAEDYSSFKSVSTLTMFI